DDRSLYEQIFQNRTVIDPDTDEFGYFTLNTERTELSGANENLVDHTATILSALQITEEELSLIMQMEGLTGLTGVLTMVRSAGKLSLANLSKLYRNVSLARALDLDVEDLLSVRVLTGLDPFAAGETATTLEFVKQAQTIDKSDFSIAELKYFL